MINFHKQVKKTPKKTVALTNVAIPDEWQAPEPSIYDAVMILKKHGIEIHKMQHMMEAEQIPKMDMTFVVFNKDSQTSYATALDFVKAWTTPYKKW